MIKSKFPFNVVLDFAKEEREEQYLDEAQEIYFHIETRNKPNLKKVGRFFQRWKKYPEAWNFYYGALAKNSRHFEAEKLLFKTMEEFPDYFYGRYNYAKRLIHHDKLEEAIDELGGETPDIKRWYPDQNTFWIEHVVRYYALFAELELKRGNYDKADEHVKYVENCLYLNNGEADLTIDERQEISEHTHDAFENINQQIMLHRLNAMNEVWANYKIIEPEYIPPTPSEEYKKKHSDSKQFNHTEIEVLYGLRLLDEGTIRSILSLPRQTVIADLEKILYHTMFEFTDEEFEKNQYYAVSHVLWFLYELDAVESMESACFLLQMDAEYIDYWFGDYWIESAWFYFYMLLKHNHRQLLDVLYLPNKNSHTKNIVLEAAVQLAYHNPEKENEVVGWLSDLLRFYIENQENEDVLDTTLTGFIEGYALDLNAKELLPQLKILHEAGCIDEMMVGDYSDVKEYFNNPEPQEKHILPLKSIFTLAEEEKKWYDETDTDLQPEPSISLPNMPAEKKYPKTGRNEPCPCGSGKKYKKCCGR